jgi:hypothetical protein
MQCDVCQAEITDPEDATEHLGRNLCEDCYMDALSPAVACDPWAVYTAKSTVEQQGDIQLTERQEQILALIDETGRIKPEELMAKMSMTEPELKRELATLRHMEITRGSREDGEIYIRRFDDR